MADDYGTRLNLLLADATSEAKRRGNAVVTPLHLAAALRKGDAPAAERVLGLDLLAAVDQRLAGLPRSYDPPVAGEDVLRVLAAAARSADPVEGLGAGIRSWLAAAADVPAPAGQASAGRADATAGPGGGPAGGPGPGTGAGTGGAPGSGAAPQQAPAAAGFTLPGRVAEVAEIVQPRSDLVPRDDVVAGILAAVGARSPALTVVVGAEGAGRTTVAECLAARLADPGYTGPLAGWPVVRARAEAIIAGARAQALLAAAQACAGRAVLVIDDLEVVLGLGSGGNDYAMLVALRSLHDDPDRRVVALLAASFLDRFGSTDRELADEVAVVALPELPPEQVAVIAGQAATTLGGYHRVTIPADVVTAACAPPGGHDPSAQPGLAVARLDRAAAAASVRPERTALVSDIPHPSSPGAVAVFDAAQALSRLASEVVGQDEALDRVVRRLRVTRSGLDLRPERPDGVFLFAGPTGTGKTATALALAKAVYGDPAALVRLDMSEFVEEHTVSNLVGSPPGYVGSTDPENWLTTRMRARPEVVLVLDEIEKAHPQVWNTFLQVFDAGRLTDRQGRTADFSRSVVVMTTNIGAAAFAERQGPGFVAQESSAAADEAAVREAIRQRMAPELVNRLDDVLVFHPLGPQVIRTIAERQLAVAVARLGARGWSVEIDPTAVDLLVRTGFSRAYGARPLQREIELRFLEPVVALGPGRYRASCPDGQTLSFQAVAG